MIMNNENKKLSRNRKRRKVRKIKLNEKMKRLLNEIQTQKKNNL